MFGPCKVCLEKDKRIADLKQEVQYLQDLSNPGKYNVQLPAVQLEADRILSGVSAPPLSDEEQAIMDERDRLLSGTF